MLLYDSDISEMMLNSRNNFSTKAVWTVMRMMKAVSIISCNAKETFKQYEWKSSNDVDK